MHRKFIALIIALAIAVTGVSLSAKPARADTEDIAKFLAGVAALAIIGAAIENRRDDNDHVMRRAHPPRPPWPHRHPQPPRPLPQSVSRFDLPASCMRHFPNFRDGARLFSERCLRRHYRFTGNLPRACYVRFDRGRHARAGYEPLCLRERGYRFARR